MGILSLLAVACLLYPWAALGQDNTTNPPTLVSLRIEGLNKTLFEGPIVTTGHVVTTKSGGTHPCNGLNNNENPIASATCTSALDDASGHQSLFTWDGTFGFFDDYFITRIGPDTNSTSQFWGILLNYQFTPVGGCQQEVSKLQQVLFAFDAFNKKFFLKASGPTTATKGQKVTYNVVDGTSGNPVQGASIGGSTTDVNGNAVVTFTTTGVQTLKATESNSIRSNQVITVVS